MSVTNFSHARHPKAGQGRPARGVIYTRFSAAVDELKNYGGLPSPRESRLIWDDIWHLEAHNSTAIEGGKLILPSGRRVGCPMLEVRLKGEHLTELSFGKKALNRQEVAVPPAIVEHHQRSSSGLSGHRERTRVAHAGRKGLVDDHRGARGQ